MEQQVAELEALVRGVEDELGRVCSKQRSKLETLERAWRERQRDAWPASACSAASVASAQATPAKSAPRRERRRVGAGGPPPAAVNDMAIRVDPHGQRVKIVDRQHGERAEEHPDGEQPATHAHLVETIHALRAELEARDCQERRQNEAYVRRIAQMEKDGEECVQHLEGEIDRLLYKVMRSSVSSASALPVVYVWLRARTQTATPGDFVHTGTLLVVLSVCACAFTAWRGVCRAWLCTGWSIIESRWRRPTPPSTALPSAHQS
jgi:hypothetical protein